MRKMDLAMKRTGYYTYWISRDKYIEFKNAIFPGEEWDSDNKFWIQKADETL